MGSIILLVACVAVAAYQLARVPRLWAFVLLFVALMPKVPLAVVPGNTTPIRVDDLVMGGVLVVWIAGFVTVRRPGRQSAAGAPETAAIPPSPATFFLLVYAYAAAASTLLGIWTMTTDPLTGVLHVGRLVEYGLLYYLVYTSIRPADLDGVVEVVRTALLLVCGIWLAQHWTHAPVAGPPTPWATLYPTFSATYDFGGFLMLSTALVYAVWTTGASRSVLTTIALVAGVVVTVNSDSRASLAGLALIVAIDLVVRLRWWAIVALGAAAAAAPYLVRSRKMLTLITGITAIVTSWDTAAIRQVFQDDPSLALRLRNWRLAIEHWLARPFFGDGLGGYLAYARQYDQPSPPDGWYVRVLADTGVVGFVAFVLLMAALLWIFVARLRTETQPLRHAIVYGSALAVVAALVSAVLVDTFVSYKIMGVFWTIVACGTRVAAGDGAVRGVSNRPVSRGRLEPPAAPATPAPPGRS